MKPKPELFCEYILICLLLNSIMLSVLGQRHPECGESPAQKYRSLAKAIGKSSTKKCLVFNH